MKHAVTRDFTVASTYARSPTAQDDSGGASSDGVSDTDSICETLLDHGKCFQAYWNKWMYFLREADSDSS